MKAYYILECINETIRVAVRAKSPIDALEEFEEQLQRRAHIIGELDNRNEKYYSHPITKQS